MVALDRVILMEDAVYEFTQGYMEEIELQVVVGIKLHMEVVVSQRGGRVEIQPDQIRNFTCKMIYFPVRHRGI